MTQRRQCLRLARETGCKGRVPRQRLRQNLERNQAVELRLPCLEHATHPALADEFHDFQVRKRRRHGLA